MSNGIPNPLVLTVTTMTPSPGACPPNVATQLQNGITFDVAFETSRIPPGPDRNGVVVLETTPQNNFTALTPLTLTDPMTIPNSNSGSGLPPSHLEFETKSSTTAQVFGQPQTVNGIYLVGTLGSGPGGYDWDITLHFGTCRATNLVKPVRS